MKPGVSTACLLAAAFVIAPPSSAYYIQQMAVEATVHPDSSVSVRESIRVNFEQEQRHGIYRDIRVRDYDRYGSARRLRVKVLDVADGAGGRRNYQAFRTGPYLRVKIGDADSYVSGVQDFVLQYEVRNSLLYFGDHDEFYWNATGDEWPVPIQSASAVVRLDGKKDMQGLLANGWIGPAGSKEQAEVRMEPGTGRYWSPRELTYREGLTVALGWANGLVQPPSTIQKLIWFVGDNFFAIVPVLYLLGFLAVFLRAGKDPDIGVSETVRYDPPDELRPAEVGTLIDESADMNDITATIIDLAVRGYLTIEEGESPGLLGRRSYVLHRVTQRTREDYRGGLSGFEETIFDKLFALGDTINTEQLNNSFYVTARAVQAELYEGMLTRKYFSSRPDSVRNSYLGAGLAMLVGGFFLAMFMASQQSSGAAAIAPGWGVALSLCGLVTLAFAKLMPKKTAAGRRAHIDSRGFEEYLRRAERDDIILQERQGVFEKFLPYAIGLRVADQWARAFEGIYTEPPEWFVGDMGRGFHTGYFVGSLNRACSSMGVAMTSTPRSASSGGSAFGGGGGGGFSGGGFGGGGGGAW